MSIIDSDAIGLPALQAEDGNGQSTLVRLALISAAGRIAAAEALELRLKEAGISAAARGHLDESGCTVAVFVRGPDEAVLRVLDDHAVPLIRVKRHADDERQFHTYIARVMGNNVTLAVYSASGATPTSP